MRSVLLEILLADQGYLGAYRELCKTAREVPDPQIWGSDWTRPQVHRLVSNLEWYEVFDLLEEHATASREINEVNESFVRNGLAYEMYGARGASEIGFYDPEGDEFEVVELEDEALEHLHGKFLPVKEQYERALSAMRARPADDEKAIGEGIGALEAVVRIIGGGQDFGKNINKIFANEPDWAKALARSLTALYGYSSQVPGARHGRYTDPLVTHEEALYVVRTCGSAVVYLIAGDRAGRWPDHR